MTRKKRRAIFIICGLVTMSFATGLVLWALQSRVTFFKSPSEVMASPLPPSERFRLGGLVANGSFRKQGDATAVFTVTDGSGQVPVEFKGILPDLFREGQGVVAEGTLNDKGVFVADTVLAKHDEKYMPKEVADALKKSGRWQEQGAKQPGS